jgi:hypothetical protein
VKSCRFLFIAILGVIVSTRAQALLTRHGSEPLGCSGWSAPLTEIVNDPARVSGEIGPLGPIARFYYRGDLAAFVRVLSKYTALPQRSRVVYLGTGLDSEDDFELCINLEGHGFLHLNANGHIPLDQIKIPAGIVVEAFPEPGEPTNPEENARLAQQRKRIVEAVANWKATPVVAASGVLAPSINALGPDGNALLPEHFKDKVALLVFWSLHDPASIRQFGVLENLRREFAGRPVQIISLCVDEDWEEWQRMMNEQGFIDFGDGPKPFNSDHQWWQLIQDAQSPSTAVSFGMFKTPDAFLIGPDGRLGALHIPSEKLREAVNASLRSISVK